MASAEERLDQAIQRCEQGSATELQALCGEASRPEFLTGLDEPAVYKQRVTPDGVQRFLICLASQDRLPDAGNRLAALASFPAYAASDEDGTLRRQALLEALGYVNAPGPAVFKLLEEEVVEGEYRASAVNALARLGTPEALDILQKRIFDIDKGVLEEDEYDIAARNYTAVLGQYRDRPDVLAFLLGELHPNEMELAVVECMLKDRIPMGADPEFDLVMAPLTSDTPQAADLALQIAEWMVTEADALAFDEAIDPVAAHVSELLGLPPVAPGTEDPLELKQWCYRTFEEAEGQADDAALKESLAKAKERFR